MPDKIHVVAGYHGRSSLPKLKKFSHRKIQCLRDIYKRCNTWRGLGGFNLLNMVAAEGGHFCKLLLSDSSLLAVIQNI